LGNQGVKCLRYGKASNGDSLAVLDMTDKCIALIFSLMILLQAYLVRRFAGTWLFPACLLGLFWFGLTFIPLVVLFSVPVQPYAVGFIFLCLLAFSASAFFFEWKGTFKSNAQKTGTGEVVYGSRFLKFAFYFSVVASLALIAWNSHAQGITLNDLIFNFFISAQSYREMSSFDELNAASVERWSVIFAYMGAILGGLRFSCPSKKGKRLVIVLAFLPSVLIALTQSSKWHLLLCSVLFYSGLLVYRLSTGNLRLIEKGKTKSLIAYAVILITIVTVSFMARGLYSLDDDNVVTKRLTAYFASYSCGHIYAFSDWFSFFIGGHSEIGYAHEAAGHGFYTFATLFKMMGSQSVLPAGAFDDYYSYGELLTSNVYTMFRGLILDFGFAGSIAFMFLLGLLFHGAFYFMLSRNRPVFTVAVFVWMMGLFFASFVISILGSNIIYYVAFVLIGAALYLNKKLTRQPMTGSQSYS
jgi:oligosaccharide repeat unit polymerase